MSGKFEELLDFPNEFTFRIIAYAKDTIVQDCSDVLQGIFGEIKNTGFEPSSSGRFYRIHITVIAKAAYRKRAFERDGSKLLAAFVCSSKLYKHF